MTKGSVRESAGTGRRIATVSGTNVVRHVYDGMHVVADLDGQGNILRSYTWGPGIDNLLALTVYGPGGTNTYQALTDHLGTVHALVTTNGTVAERYEYDAWGNVLGVLDGNGGSLPSSVLGLRYLFQGREYSWAVHAATGGTGLYNFRARWYDPLTGRWLSNDPIGISGGLNQYAFCAHNPVMFVDPEGLSGEITNNSNEYINIKLELDTKDHRQQWVRIGPQETFNGPVDGIMWDDGSIYKFSFSGVHAIVDENGKVFYESVINDLYDGVKKVKGGDASGCYRINDGTVTGNTWDPKAVGEGTRRRNVVRRIKQSKTLY